MGIFYYVHSVALIEDLPLEHTYKKPSDFYTDADKGYGQVIFPAIPLHTTIRWNENRFFNGPTHIYIGVPYH